MDFKLKNKTINQCLQNSFINYGDNNGIIYPEENQIYKYKDIQKNIDSIAKGLITIGIKKGEHIAIYSYNSLEYVLLTLAILKIGAIIVPLNINYNKYELRKSLIHSDSTILFVNNKDSNIIKEIIDNCSDFKTLKSIISIKDILLLSELIEEINLITDRELNEISNNVKPEDIATLLYTSGTTSDSKAVLTSHKSIINSVLAYQRTFKYTSDDVIFSGLPLFHMMGLEFTIFLALFIGASVVITKKFKTSLALELIEQEKCTVFHGVPTMYQFFLEKSSCFNLDSLKKGFIAGAVCTRPIIENIFKKLNLSSLCLAYGQTETLGVTSIVLTPNSLEKINSVGQASDFVEIKIIDINTKKELKNQNTGEIYIKSPGNMVGYYKNEEANNNTIFNDWIATGDIGFLDEDNYLILKGRNKDIIIRGGENISPTEIEEFLLSHKKIKNASVIGVKDDLLGEEICACIILNDNEIATKEEISSYISNNLAKYKKPKYIEFFNEFPLTSSHKIQKFKLNEIINKRGQS